MWKVWTHQKQSLTVSLSDVDSEREVENECAKNVTALTRRYISNFEPCDEDLTYWWAKPQVYGSAEVVKREYRSNRELFSLIDF